MGPSGPQPAFLEAEKSVHGEDVPSGKPPLSTFAWGRTAAANKVGHSPELVFLLFPQNFDNLGYSCAYSVLRWRPPMR